MTELDIAYVRAQFPAFSHEETGGWAFFENAGGAYGARQVIDQLNHFMIATKVQPYGHSAPSGKAGAAMDRSTALWAEAINAGPDEVMFGPSTTMNTYVLAHALRGELGTGDEIIVTNQDHEANIGAWRRLGDGNSGIVVREWQVDPDTGLLDLMQLENLLSDRTRLVAVTHASNIIGDIHHIARIAEIVHRAGARIAVDGVSYAPHLAVDVQALDVDFYFCSLYKVYGPHQGLMYARREHLARMANQGHYFNAGQLSKRLTPAGPQHGEIACAGGVIDYLADVHARHFPDAGADLPLASRVQQIMRRFHGHETVETTRILDLLRTKPVRILGNTSAIEGARAPTIAFVPHDQGPGEVAERLAGQKIATGSGHFYAARLMQALGIDPEQGVVRLSLVHYNSAEDVTRLLTALDDIL